MKYLLFLIIPMLLNANLTYISNHSKDISILETFDIDPSFLYDDIMNDMRTKSSSSKKNKFFFRAMNNAYLYIPTIKAILTKYNIPQELLYLAMAESNFSNKAYSHKKASGIWQFMPYTAKLYNLKIDNYVDERRDFVKSTEAAAKHLSHLYKQFGKWYLAIIAYNCGGGKLNRAIKEAGTDSLVVLLDSEKKYIPKESRFYIRKIMALAMIGYDENFMLKSKYEYLLNRANASSIATIKLPAGESIQRISKLIDIPIDELQKLNRHLKYDFIPPYAKSYNIYIPYDKLYEFKKNYFEQPIKNIYKIHKVSSGENLSVIGKRYNVPYKMIMDFNKLKNTRLKLKQTLIIPINKNNRIVPKKIDYKDYYTVKKGDSLESISLAYNISIKTIQYKNNIQGSLIKIGERLKIDD